MPKKTARQALDSTLKRLKASVPDSFAPDPASPLHENVQRLLASGLTETNTYDATYRHHQSANRSQNYQTGYRPHHC